MKVAFGACESSQTAFSCNLDTLHRFLIIATISIEALYYNQKGTFLAITTPVMRDIDSVFPGENWFFYWKTSAALWESKLRENATGSRVIIPINWAFHSETGEGVDFGEHRPETDLKKLISIIQGMGKTATLFLPVSPVPFLPNGGIPFLLAKTMGLNEEELANIAIDGEGSINKMFSFFEPKVFQGFRKFVVLLGQFLEENSISSTIWGIDCGHLEGGEFKRYFDDRSSAFKKSFSRFLSVKKNEENLTVEGPLDEAILMEEFSQTIRMLYTESSQEIFGERWEGVLKISFSGGNSYELMDRIAENFSELKYVNESFRAISRGAVPSSILLPARVKDGGVVSRQLSNIVAQSALEVALSRDCYDDDDIQFFKPLYFFEVVRASFPTQSKSWKRIGLYDYLQANYGYNYLVREGSAHRYNPEEKIVFFFHGEGLDDTSFAQMLKIFMDGGKVIFNTAGLNEKLTRRLEIFLIENSLKVDHASFMTEIKNVELGEGRLVLFDADLLPESKDKIFEFWDRVVNVFSIPHLNNSSEDGVEYYWQTRSALMSELSYEEVRRFSVYNCTSYKKKVRLPVESNFAFTKIVDEINAKVQSGQSEIEIELHPRGSVSLDFGLFN